MYQPKVFREADQRRLHDLIASHSFGALITTDEQGALEISHLPFLLDRDHGPHGALRVHVARANRIWKLATAGRPVTVVFDGPHGYVSPRWYEHPREQVPTWNYAVVHAHGRAVGPMDRADLAQLLDDLSAFHEADAPEPWRFAELDAALREQLLAEIVGMTIVVERLEGKLKLSQNRSAADHDRVVRAFRERGRPDDLEMVRLMTEKG